MNIQNKWLIVVGLGLLSWLSAASADSMPISPPKLHTLPNPPKIVIIIHHLP